MIILIALVIIFIAVAWVFYGGHVRNTMPYVKGDALFSNAEKHFLASLEKALKNEHRIFGKVRVADIVNTKQISNRSKWQVAFNKIAMKHFDFVLCDRNSLDVLAVVELDDSSHQKKERQQRDRFIDELCSAVSLPLIRVKAKKVYDVLELRTIIFNATGVSAASLLPTKRDTSSPPPYSDSVKEGPQVCQTCSSKMVLRASGWDCTSFPPCSSKRSE